MVKNYNVFILNLVEDNSVRPIREKERYYIEFLFDMLYKFHLISLEIPWLIYWYESLTS